MFEIEQPPFDVRYYPAPVPLTGVSDTPLVTIQMNAAWVSHVSGLCERLLYADAWQGTDTEIDTAIQETQKLLVMFGKALMDSMPARAFMFHNMAAILSGAAFAVGAATQQPYNVVCYQNPSANGSAFTQSFVLKAGTYTFSVLGVHANVHGKIDWYLDNALIISGQDWYAAATAYNILKTASVTVVGDGRHVLKGVVNGKNVSSANYFIPLTAYWLAPSAD